MKTFFSKLFSTNTKDWIKGLWTAISGAVLGAILPTLQNWVTSENWDIIFDWKTVAKLGIGAGLAYVLRKFMSNSDDKFLQSEKSATDIGSGTVGTPK